MLIGVDMRAVRSPWTRHRGIGRRSRGLIPALLAGDTANHDVLYAHHELPTDQIPASPNATVLRLSPDLSQGESALPDAVERLVRTNPDGLDVLLLLNPFEVALGYGPPARPLHGLRLASVISGLIPFRFQEQPVALDRQLERLRRYDLLLAISGATRSDCLELLGVPADRVVDASTGIDGHTFVPDRSEPMPAASREVLERFGITRPLVFHQGGHDDRKNVWGLIDAFGLLCDRLRREHQLVVTSELAARVRRYAEERGVADRLVLTGAVPDATLRVLYQRCAAFAFPSHSEGFGRPILEALSCGAAVVAGNNSAQVEVVGQAGPLVETRDPTDIAAKLGRVLADGELAARRRGRAVEQARRFSRGRSAEQALETPAALGPRPAGGRRLRRDRGGAPRPRLAMFSPLPPKGSGISDYTVRLLGPLSRDYAVDLYHDSGYVPHIGLASPAFACYDYRLFPRNAQIKDYRGVVYQMGNSHFHKYFYETMLRHPGVVTLHDFCLIGFHMYYPHWTGVAPDHYPREIEYNDPERAVEIFRCMDEWGREPGGIGKALVRRGLFLNRRIFAHARSVIVHSPWCLERVRLAYPEYVAKTAVVPMGATPRVVSPERRQAIRQRFDLPQDVTIVASFGILSADKMNVEAIEAFAPLARAVPAALFLLVGQDWGGGEACRKAQELRIDDRVRFLGRLADADFADLIAVTDVGVSLRQSPTYGETSAALLDLLRAGIATIVTDVDTFTDYPETVVRKVRWESEGLDGLRRAMQELVVDRPAREALGRAALRHVELHHTWDRATALYVEVIERCYAEGRRSGGDRARPASD